MDSGLNLIFGITTNTTGFKAPQAQIQDLPIQMPIRIENEPKTKLNQTKLNWAVTQLKSNLVNNKISKQM